MKILNKKVLIVIILFFSFLIFNKSNCFATYEFNDGHIAPDNSMLKKYVYFVNPSDYGVKYYYCFTSDEKFTVTFESKTKLKFNHKVLWLVYGPEYKSYTKFGGSDYFIDNASISYGTFITKYSNVVIYDSSGGIIFEPEKDIQKVTPTLYIDDQNLKKRFKFQFEIPLEKEDTKYYVFLQKYTRNSYDSVTATFTIYTVSTPEGYDATNYENYMYYDLPSKGLYLPAGCSIKEYKITSANNDRGNLELINEFISEHIKHYFVQIAADTNTKTATDISQIIFNSGLQIAIKENELVKTNAFIFDTNFNSIFSNFFTAIKKTFKLDISSKDYLSSFGYDTTSEYLYNSMLKVFYYANENLEFSFDDLAFSNYTVVSYENSRNIFKGNCYFYNYFRKTKVYNQENKINDNMFAFNYSDGQDVSSLLPDGLDVGYLTSPWFKDNEKSTSKGNITYDINEIIQGDKIIDYSKEDNSIHNNFNGDYIENFKEGDNITINNYYTETIEKTSDSHLLHNIYVAILEIKQLLSNTNDKISNTTNNITYNVSNTVTYLFVPTSLGVQTELEKLDNSAKEHLGIIYEPFDLLIYTVTLFTNIDNSTEIVLSAPAVSWKDHEIIPVTNFSFNQFFDQAPKFKEIHDIYLMSVDFIVIGLLLYLAYKKFKEVFNK